MKIILSIEAKIYKKFFSYAKIFLLKNVLQKILIEQKSLGKNLSDAYDQAKFYDNELPFDKKSRWIICRDFQKFEVHGMNAQKKSARNYFFARFKLDV